jgi:hypothetical protein
LVQLFLLPKTIALSSEPRAIAEGLNGLAFWSPFLGHPVEQQGKEESIPA